MNSPVTMVYIDLADSTAAYAALGNATVADAISMVTQWIGRVCETREGRIVKYLGDGVLAQFAHSSRAVEAVVFLQRSHSARLIKRPAALRMGLKIGLARGAVVHRDGDTYGDPINLASRLSDMAGAFAIWADESVIDQLRRDRAGPSPGPGGDAAQPGFEKVRYRSLGLIRVRGLAQPRSVFQIEWDEEISSDLMTVRGVLPDGPRDAAGTGGSMALAWLGNSRVFTHREMPIRIGRMPDCSFVVSDQRVSRVHARIEFVNGAFVLTDLSSFGSWVRFADNPETEILLRRNTCILHSTGEIALGAPFSDFSTAVIAFHVNSASSQSEPNAPTIRSLFDDSAMS